MRVLSLGHRIRHRSIDNHTILNAPNIADYDAIILDLDATFEAVREAAQHPGKFTTHADVVVVNGDSIDGAASLADLLRRRREEMVRALDNGAIVAVFMAPQSRFYGVTGLSGFDRYFFLPAPDGIAWDDRTIQASEGAAAAVVDHDHPFVGVVEVIRPQLLYRAVINDRAESVARVGHTFLRAPGGHPVGIDFKVLNGHIVFLPTPRTPNAEALASTLGHAFVEAMSDALGRSDDPEPRWASEFSPPGLEDHRNEVQRARATLDQAQAALDEAEAGLKKEQGLRDALWSTGDAALLPAALTCAEAIGFRTARDGEGRPVLMDGPQTSIHLVVGGSNEAVGMAAHYRLRARLDRIIEERAVSPRGLIVVNGQRETHPLERKRQIEDALRVAAEAQGYAIVTASDLFRVAYAARAGLPDAQLAEARSRLATTNGVVELADLMELGTPADVASASAVPDEPPHDGVAEASSEARTDGAQAEA
ncbi:MAG: hypothetical protein DWG83_01035 [Chloroflexi bacterium]|nr:hypothetical protein [Chloroflexota bacterium]